MTTHMGLGWDPERNIVTGLDDVLTSLASSLKNGDRIIEAGLRCYDMCTEMFRTTVATESMARSSTQFAIEDEEEDTGTRESSSRSRVRGRSFFKDVSMGCNSGGTSTSCAPISGEDVLGSGNRRPTTKQNVKQTRFFQALDEWKEMQDAKSI
ncbi:hypothetical protein BUALT_Bualt15G0056800 [Buddleja alternifolia]|uniref:Uncharacterized protein n=1 Tax=Buddleja alternifolia TaxID=168488 RepID=A0AAV6WAZ6_9LAMI|nr:hypothetical protein BUALT_Bualt15G0056800 [Buddleja alternifolia]